MSNLAFVKHVCNCGLRVQIRSLKSRDSSIFSAQPRSGQKLNDEEGHAPPLVDTTVLVLSVAAAWLPPWCHHLTMFVIWQGVISTLLSVLRKCQVAKSPCHCNNRNWAGSSDIFYFPPFLREEGRGVRGERESL